MLKLEQLQAVCHIYKGRDVFLWLPTTFGKSICHEVLPFLLDCKLGKSESSIVIVVSPLVVDHAFDRMTCRYGTAILVQALNT